MADYQGELERLVGQLNRGRHAGPDTAAVPSGDMTALLRNAVGDRASDLLLVAGSAPALRVHGAVRTLALPVLSDDEVRGMVLPLLTPTEYAVLQKERA